MTLDEQLGELRPLTRAAVAALAGYSHSDVFSSMRARGSRMPEHRLRTIAERLRALADLAEEAGKSKQANGIGPVIR